MRLYCGFNVRFIHVNLDVVHNSASHRPSRAASTVSNDQRVSGAPSGVPSRLLHQPHPRWTSLPYEQSAGSIWPGAVVVKSGAQLASMPNISIHPTTRTTCSTWRCATGACSGASSPPTHHKRTSCWSTTLHTWMRFATARSLPPPCRPSASLGLHSSCSAR